MDGTERVARTVRALAACVALLAFAVLLGGCADRLGIGSAPAAAAPLAGPMGTDGVEEKAGVTRIALQSEEPVPVWLTESLPLFTQVTGTVVDLPAPPSPESSASAEAPLPEGDARLIDAAEAQELAGDGRLSPLPGDLATALAGELTEPSFRAFERQGRHWGIPLTANWLGLIVDPQALPSGERGAPPLLDDWLAQLRRVKVMPPAGGAPAPAPLWVAWDEPGCADTFALLVAALGGRLLNDRGLPAFADEGDAGKKALALMLRLLEERFVPRNALETRAADLPAALHRGHTYWIGWSDTLEEALRGEESRLLLRRLGQLEPAAFPVDAGVYSYENRPAVLVVRYRGFAVPASRAAAAPWRLARFVSHPAILDAATPLTTVLRRPAPPSGSFADRSRALLAQERHLVSWELTPAARLTLGRHLQAALKKVLTPEEALTKAARALGAPVPPPPAPATEPRPGLSPGIATPGTPGGPATPGASGSSPAPGSGTAPGEALPPTTGPAPGSVVSPSSPQPPAVGLPGTVPGPAGTPPGGPDPR